MNTIIERYKAFTAFLVHLFTHLFTQPSSLPELIGKIILFVILFILALVIFSFTGAFEDPLSLLRFN